MLIRKVRLEDAEGLAKLINQVEEETDFMLYGAGERQMNQDIAAKMIGAFSAQRNSAIFVAEMGNELAGYLLLIGGASPRNRHAASLVIGILQNASGQGLGSDMMASAFQWAKEAGLSRIELTVMQHNERAQRLYRKVGFEQEGVKRNSLLVHGEYVDELIMAKLL